MALILLLVGAAGSRAQPSPDAAQAAAFVKKLYSGDPMKTPERYFDPPMVELMAEDARLANGEEGALDSDPFCDCQDSDGLRAQVTVKSVTPSDATVEADLTFSHDAEKDKVTYYLVKINGAWRIHDMSTKDYQSLRQLFITSNASQTQSQHQGNEQK